MCGFIWTVEPISVRNVLSFTDITCVYFEICSKIKQTALRSQAVCNGEISVTPVGWFQTCPNFDPAWARIPLYPHPQTTYITTDYFNT